MVVNNPNNWHWVDKNCLAWSKTYFEDKLTNLTAKDEDSTVSISSVSSVEGDVDVSQRKGKVISLFDVKIILEFKGKTKNDPNVDGSITIPELSYDSDESDLQFQISIFNESKDNFSISDLIKQKLLPQLRNELIKFGPDLIEINSKDIQLDKDQVTSTYTKANQETQKTTTTASTPVKAVEKTQEKPKESKKSVNNTIPKYNTSTLHLEPSFNTTAEQLYKTFLEEPRITAWTRSYPIIEQPVKEGSEFKFFGGSVQGKFLKLVENSEIIQLWRLDDWKIGHYAQLTIKFVQDSSETKMIVKFTGIPIGEEERVRDNFEERYIKSIKITFGFGAVL
ncbi:unnamed protein product [Candida verbasci]|uniref:Activator of Hsp90 ATPase AHSA1-like N-terminal domain-containing protein n=1 Tax=Candida verbasci TaxID=1227364 RepID=A0A9W4TRU1_9ASCO|nr:unnamed protein product [Candida verbasci]